MAKANSQPFRGTFVLMIFMTFWVLLVTAAADSEKYPNGTKGTNDTEQLVPVEDNGSKKVKTPGWHQGFVYLIRMPKFPKLIKVGQTQLDLETRRRTLNSGNPYALKIEAAWEVKDKKLGEKAAHRYLDGNRSYARARQLYGGGREWFIVKHGGIRKVCKGIERNLDADKLIVKRVIR